MDIIVDSYPFDYSWNLVLKYFGIESRLRKVYRLTI